VANPNNTAEHNVAFGGQGCANENNKILLEGGFSRRNFRVIFAGPLLAAENLVLFSPANSQSSKLI
jgi:hypothetical protein